MCDNWDSCLSDIDCDINITSWLVMHHQFQWWNLIDLTWNGNDGVITWDTKIVDGKTDESVSFDGDSDFIEVMDTTGSTLDVQWAITLSTWVYPRAFDHGQNGSWISTIMTKSGAYYMNFDDLGRPRFYRYGLSTPWYHVSPVSVPLNTWSHIVSTYDGSEIKIFIDWVETLSVPWITWSWTMNNDSLWFGKLRGNTTNGYRDFDGVIDDARIYDRALSLSEINQLVTNWLDMCESISLPWDGCSDQCEIEYCRDDAPITDTSKNFAITNLSPSEISWTSTQANSKVAICFEDSTWSRDIVYTSTDAAWGFIYIPALTTYTPNRINIWVMLHDQNNIDIDHHSLILPN